MYLPAQFEETDLQALHAGISQSPFGTLVTLSGTGLEANHLPFELDAAQGSHGVLRCHVSRANAVWKAVTASSEALVIFQGPSAYVSPSLYASKPDTHQVVPTYNYVAIHAHGRVLVHDDARWLHGLVGRLTRRYENARETPWKISDAPPAFIEERLQQIVGLEIVISRIEGKWKMSQNREERDQRSVMAGLADSPDAADREVAAEMQRLRR